MVDDDSVRNNLPTNKLISGKVKLKGPEKLCKLMMKVPVDNF